MIKKNKKNVTLDNLAGTVKRGFDGVDKKLDKVDAQFGDLEDGIEEIKLKLDQVAYRFEIQELERRLKELKRN